MARSHGAASPACTPSNFQQPGGCERVTKHGAMSPSGHARHAPSSSRPADQVQEHKESHGRASGYYPSPGKSSHPPTAPPSRLAHLTLGLLAPAPHHPFAEGGRTCTTPYLSHEVLLKRPLLEGLCPQAVCKGEQGSARAGLQTFHPSFPFPCLCCQGAAGEWGLQGHPRASGRGQWAPWSRDTSPS